MGPTSSVMNILSQLETQFDHIASSDMLFQNFYEMAQQKAEKIQTFAASIERSLNLLRLMYPQCAKQLKDQLFNGMQKPFKIVCAISMITQQQLILN